MELNIFQTVLRTVAAAMKNPVIILLILFIAFSVFCIGWIIAEFLTERRHMKYSLPELLDNLKKNKNDLVSCINSSGLLARQKATLIELTRHPDFSQEMMDSLADNLLESEQTHYDKVLSATNLISKLAPMVGLLGTLIPLGPGIIALGQGDTQTLSDSMLTAFDTTIAGLMTAGVCLTIHTFRKRWYSSYMSDLEALVDSVVDIQRKEGIGAKPTIDDDALKNLTEEQQKIVLRQVIKNRNKANVVAEKREHANE
ncbi:MAG: MotA/TolQ/ExbB proton channel family protein [Bacillota bacterium]|nr:MotA/TolQ/ExbB proton channel family protein [Bacillota bacterium]